MKHESGTVYRCNNCERRLNNRRHIRILLGWTSGWMVPPFVAGMPVADLVDRNPEFHFCKPECMAAYFVNKLYAISPDTRKHEVRDRISPAVGPVFEALSAQGSRVSGADDLGACGLPQGGAGQRGVGDSAVVRVGAFSGSVSGRRRYGQEDQRMVGAQQDQELGGGQSEVPATAVATKAPMAHFIVRAAQATKKAALAVIA